LAWKSVEIVTRVISLWTAASSGRRSARRAPRNPRSIGKLCPWP